MKHLKTFALLLVVMALLTACGAAGGGGTDISVSDVGNVEGTVTDASTGTALSGVTVQVGDKSDVTGDNGVYSIQDIDVGTRTVTASKTGYQNHNGTCEISKGTTVSHNIQMAANTSSDTTPPTVSSTSPANNAADIAVNSAVTVTFSEAMDVSTITTSTFTLEQGTTPISGMVTYSGTTATFTTSANLDYSTTYTATITTGAKDTAGNAMASNYSWSFTTGTAPDTTPPTASSTSPANGETSVAINSAIAVTFSEVMDSSTITTATFILKQGTTAITGTVTYNGTTATFTPYSNLTYTTAYTATITTGVKDTAGNAMASNYTWTFTTGTAPTGANFKMPDTNQTTSYTGTFGEDSDYIINPPSYTDNGNGTITDNVTGLIWQKQDDGVAKPWTDAINYCDNLSLGAQTDWRLPTRIELISIVDYGIYTPSINTTYFPSTTISWSSSTYAFNASGAWVVNFYYGSTYYDTKTLSNYARCVRDGQ